MNPAQTPIHPQLAQLVELALETATSSLEGRETFLPGSFAVSDAGKIDLAVAGHGGSQGSNLLVIALWQKAAAGNLRAAAIYRDVRVRPTGASEDADAIHVIAELASGEAVHLFQVYGKNGAGQVVMGESELVPAPSVIFGEASRGVPRSKR
jgi:hypothetical protein